MASSSAAGTAAWAASRAAAVAVAAAGGAEAYSAAAAAMAVAVAANVAAAAAAAADDDADGRTWVDDLVAESTQLWIDDPESAVAAAVDWQRLRMLGRSGGDAATASPPSKGRWREVEGIARGRRWWCWCWWWCWCYEDFDESEGLAM